MKRILMWVGVFLLVGVVVGAFRLIRGPDLSAYQYLKDPQISAKADQKVLVLILAGDPNEVGKDAFGKLMKSFFAVKRANKGVAMAPPRVRWSWDGADKRTMVGRYAMPLPDSVTSLPEGINDEGPEVALAIWSYGSVAEILHYGAYDEEVATTKRLMDFVESNGYAAAGMHEEEYLKGPGLLRRDPKSFQTIIRYAVKKKAK